MVPTVGKAVVIRASLACHTCRKLKIRCIPSESSTKCVKCNKSGSECVFDSTDLTRPLNVGEEDRIAALESKVLLLEEKIPSMSDNSNEIDEVYIKMRLLNLETQVINLSPTQNNHISTTNDPRSSYSVSIRDIKDGIERNDALKIQLNGGDRDRSGLEEELTDGDLIDRGIINFDEARLCFESYFLSLPNQSVSSSSRKIILPFLEIRRASPLLFSTLISIGARSSSHFETFQLASNEALRLLRNLTGVLNTQFSTPCTSLDLKAMILLTLSHGMHQLASLVADVTLRLNFHQSLLQLSRNPYQTNAMVAKAIRNGRCFLMAFVTSNLYSFNARPFFSTPPAVLLFQLDVLESSPYSQQPTDRLIRIRVELDIIIRKICETISPSERVTLATYEEVLSTCQQSLKELVEWNNKFQVMMELVSSWGDTRDLKTSIPLNHGVLACCRFIFTFLVENDRLDQRDSQLEEFCQKSGKAALGMLQFGVDSKIWLHFSNVANYLHYVDIPLAVETVSIVARLYPEAIEFATIRPLFQKLLSQLESQISPTDIAMGTKAERERAMETREMVIAFEESWFDFEGLDGFALVREEKREGFDEINGSLNAFTAEVQFWGSILLDAQYD